MQIALAALAALAALCLPAGAHAADFGLHTAYHASVAAPDTGSYHIAVSCDGAALVYGLYVSVSGDDSSSYRIARDSILVGYDTVGNPAIRFDGGTAVDLLREDVTYPLPVPPLHTMVIPIHATGRLWEGAPALEVTYAAGADTTCSIRPGLGGAIPVGLIVPGAGVLAGFGDDVQNSAMMAAEDFNAYLKDERKPWSIDVVVARDDKMTPQSGVDALAEMRRNGTALLLGPITGAGLEAGRDYILSNGMFGISCCISGSYGERIYGLFPDDSGQAEALGALVRSDQIRGAVILHEDSSAAMRDSLEGHLEGIHAVTIPYGAGDAATLAQRLIYETGRLSDRYGHDGVGVVVLGGGSEYALLAESARHAALHGINWYVPPSSIGLADITETGLAGSLAGIRAEGPGPSITPEGRHPIHDAYGDGARLYHYLAYDMVWILGRTLQLSQDASPPALAEALPEALSRTKTSSAVTYNGTGYAGEYGIWHVVAGQWSRVGTYSQITGDVSYLWWYDPR